MGETDAQGSSPLRFEMRRLDGRPENLVILGFPSNNFADQEPLGDEEIGEFCSAN